MKTLSVIRLLFIFSFIFILFFTGCKESTKPEPKTWIESYQPNYTAPKGTSYQGNYFPVYANKVSGYEGTIEGSVSVKVNDQSATIPIHPTPCSGYSQILSPVNVNLSGISYLLYPERQIIPHNLYSDGVVSVERDTSIIRYYEVLSNNDVYIRAIPVPNSDMLLEVENPVFIKSILVVGDSWSASPTVNLDDYITPNDSFSVGMKIDCGMFVVGNEDIVVMEEEVEAVQLDELVEATGSIFMQTYGYVNMKINAKLTINLFLVEDVGIGKMNESGKITISGKVSAEGQTYNIIITINFTSELFLTSNTIPKTGKIDNLSLTDQISLDLMKEKTKLPVDVTSIINRVMGKLRKDVLYIH